MHSQIDIILDGPFLIVRKLSDFLYEVFCGYRGKNSIIHYDRMRKRVKSQRRKKNTQYENDSLPVVDFNALEFASAEGESRPMHSRRIPVWHDDFVVEYKK